MTLPTNQISATEDEMDPKKQPILPEPQIIEQSEPDVDSPPVPQMNEGDFEKLGEEQRNILRKLFRGESTDKPN